MVFTITITYLKYFIDIDFNGKGNNVPWAWDAIQLALPEI
jgi:hypothetical protein